MRDLIDLLQGNPYEYDNKGREEENEEENEDENAAVEKLVQTVVPYVLVGCVIYLFLDMLVCKVRSFDRFIYSYIYSFIYLILSSRVQPRYSLLPAEEGRTPGKGSVCGCVQVVGRQCKAMQCVRVFLIYSEYQGRMYAMKEWHKNPVGYEKNALEREIKVQSRLNHPNCLKLYGMSKTPDGLPVLVMQLCNGGTLTDYMKPEKRRYLTKEARFRIIKEIAEALCYMHKLGFIHRDLKQDNVLLHDNHPIIADFGLAREVDPNNSIQVTFAGSPV